MKQLLTLVLCVVIHTQVYSQSVPSYVPTNGLVGWWGFNGNAQDGSGNGNHGTVNGATLTTDRFGNQNGAYSFDGQSSIQTLNSGPLGTGITLSYWYKTHLNNYMSLVSYGSLNWGQYFDANLNHWAAQHIGPCFGPSFHNRGTIINKNSFNIDSTIWSHVVIVIPNNISDLQSVDFYLNGNLLYTTCSFINYGAPSPNISNGNPIKIGNNWFNDGAYIGKLDDIGIWNRALTQQEITNLYNAQNPQPCTTSITNNINISGCGFAVLSSGDTVNQSGTYIDTLLNSLGCDSILNQLVTIQNPSTCNPVPSYVPTNGLVGWWGFNGNAQDGSGNGNHGTVNGATLTTDRFGSQNRAYSFDGINDYIIANATTNMNESSRTISLWINEIIDFGQYEFLCLGNSSSTSWGCIASNGNMVLNHGRGCSNNISQVLPINFSLSSWHHLVYVTTGVGGNTHMYFNGQYIGNGYNASSVGSCASNYLYFGVDVFSISEYLSGSLDDIGIWNRALTPQEITNLYNAQTCQVNITSQPTSQTSQLNNSINFSVTSSDSNSTYRWQTDTGGGFFDLNDGGQYSGASMSVLTISAINLQNHNQSFRCIVSTQNCGSDTSDVATLSVQNPNVLTGTLNYANSSLTPLPGVPVHLRSYLGYVVGSDTTDSLGVFALGGYPNGNYYVDADINYSVNSVNSSDALQTQRFVVLLEMLNNLQQKSADVSGNQRVTSNDALMIRLLSAGVIGQFPVDKFVNTRPSVTFAGGIQSVQILTLASGDVNGNLIVQYNPPILVLDTVFSLGNVGTATVRFPTAGSGVFERGICWGNSPAPTIQNDHVNVGSGGFDFSHSFDGLTGGSTYFVRAYARNPVGIFYSNEVSIIAVSWNRCPGTPTVTDIDGNMYNTVQIGNQCWMQSNLKVSRFRNGDSILTGFSNSDWYNLFYTPAYSIYNNDAQNEIIFGKLYNHVSVRDSREICPTGWHVPTDTEWNVLVKFLDSGSDTSCNNCIQSQIAGGALKSTSILPIQSGWMPPNTGATNSSGFFGTPGGMRDGHTGTFNDLRNVAFWWTSSTSYAGHPARVVVHNAANFYKGGNFHGLYGFSVRCLRDSSAGGGGSASVPSVTTVAISGVSATGALTGGDVSSDGGSTVTSRGVAYGLSTNPTTAGNITTDGSGVGSFVSTLTGLTSSTQYFLRAYATNSIGTAYGNEVSFSTNVVNLGDTYAGGIVFYVDSTGQHGLVCAPSDQGSYEFGCSGTYLPGAFSILLGSGQANTNLIINGCVQRPIAASVCADLVLNGYNDWFLPSSDELSIIYTNLKSQGMGNFSNNWYWSSSQAHSYLALGVNFFGGNLMDYNKNHLSQVRAVRAF